MDLTPHIPINDPLKDERTLSSPRALADTMSWGEQLLPLAYAAMQCCWMATLLIGFGRLHFFGQTGPFMPLWAPFLIVLVSAWCALTLPDHTAGTQKRYKFTLAQLRSSVTAVIIVQAVIILCVVWGTFYSNVALWNPIWLGTFFYDLLQINSTAFASIAIILLSYGLSYHGIRTARYAIEPSTVTRGLIIGGMIFALVILLQAVSDLDQANLLLLLLLFFCLALFTRALAHAIFVRQEHLIGLHGNKYIQDRLVMSTVGLVCLLLTMIALIVSVIFNPALLTAIMDAMSPAGQLYDKIAHGLAMALAFLLSFIQLNGKLQSQPTIQTPQGPFKPLKQAQPQQVPAVVQSFASVMLIIIIIAAIVTIVIVTARILRKRALVKRVQRDQHESLWSWSLFWSQIKGLLLALLNRFKRHETAQPVEEHSREEEESMVVNRDVRAIYRAFLQWTASRGFSRWHNETPYELEQRLNQPFAPLGPEIQVVTEIYTTARYSQNQPAEAEIERMQQNWNSLQQKNYGLQTES